MAAGARRPAGVSLLFDVDGTLVDSRQLITDVWRQVAAEFGADAEAILAVCHGRRDADVVPMFFRPEDVCAVLERILHLEEERGDLARPVPGAPALLGGLADDQWAAVTSGPSALMTGRLRHAGLPVPKVLVAADDVEHGKPHPEGYLAAARALRADPARCVVVEDAPAGVVAGRSAGMFVVAVTTTHTAAELGDAHVVVEGLNDLHGVLADAFPAVRLP